MRVDTIMYPNTRQPGNDEIAEMLERIADLLEAQHASVYRIRAYRAGARSVRSQQERLCDSIEPGKPDSLVDLPAIGKSQAALIREFVSSGRSRLLERLEGQTSPADLFASVPGIGEELAERIEKQLHLETLEDLEAAAHDGRLEEIQGFGARRLRGVQESLGNILRYSATRRAQRQPHAQTTEMPSVSALLGADRLYVEESGRGKLRRISPRRFNPDRRAWLPVLHLDLEGWSMTVMFSNTARAHQLGRTGEWVVVYYERDGVDGQCTVVTEHSGSLEGRRVIRGREAECDRYYRSTPSGDSNSPPTDSA